MNNTFYRVRTEEEKEQGISPMLDQIKSRYREMGKMDVPEEQARILSHEALFFKRQFVIDKIKKPLMKVIILIANRLFPVTRENCVQSNTRILFDIEDKFFELENNPGREQLFRASFKIFKFEYEHDPYYRYRFDWLLEELTEMVISGKWLPRPAGEPSFCWKEPDRKEKHWYTL